MNKTVFITGASSGIGLATARIFAASGATLILNARRKDKLDELGASLTAEFAVKVHLLPFDVSRESEVDHLVGSLDPDLPIDILVNNAGLALDLTPVQDGDTRSWDTMIDTNLKGLLYVSRRVIEGMTKRKSGHVINIGSTAGLQAYPNGNVYCATKAAVIALSNAMRIDLLPYGIHVTVINPGATETEFSLVRFKGDTQKAGAVYTGFEALKGEDIAEAIFFAANRPQNVNIAEITITPNAQANSLVFSKNPQ